MALRKFIAAVQKALAVAIATAVLWASPATAVTRVVIHDRTVETSFRVSGDAGPNSITLTWGPAGETVLVRDTRVRVVARSCTRSGLHAVRCPFGGADYFDISAHAGDDQLDLGHPPVRLNAGLGGGLGDDLVIGSGFRDLLFGGRGDDRLMGRGGGDDLLGEVGADVLIGGAGDDFVGPGTLLHPGDPGGDIYRGGRGDDHLNGADHLPDLALDGGAGEDRCAVDRRGDPKPRSCERVRRR